MYCVLGENGEIFLVVICRIVHRLLLREYELFVNIIHAWLIKDFFLVPFLKRWSKAQQRFTGGWGPDPSGIVLLFIFLFFYFCCVIIAFRLIKITELFDYCSYCCSISIYCLFVIHRFRSTNIWVIVTCCCSFPAFVSFKLILLNLLLFRLI